MSPSIPNFQRVPLDKKLNFTYTGTVVNFLIAKVKQGVCQNQLGILLRYNLETSGRHLHLKSLKFQNLINKLLFALDVFEELMSSQFREQKHYK